MRYVVELTSEENFTERMNDMRGWLDHRHCEPIAFRVAPGECQVHFASESEATDFAREFGGRVVPLPQAELAIR